MTCRSCGATIADKAIVCYKCGTPTAIPEAPRRQVATPEARPGRPWLPLILGLLLLAAEIAMFRPSEMGLLRVLAGAFGLVLAVSLIVVAVLRWRR